MSNNCNDLSDFHPSNGTCPATAYQTATISVPVTITPFAKAGKTRTCCCGAPIISCCSEPQIPCPTKSYYCTLTQTICVAVPVEFGANAIIGDYSVEFDETTSEDINSVFDETTSEDATTDVNAVFEKDEMDQL